jgi:hypothetical protein
MLECLNIGSNKLALVGRLSGGRVQDVSSVKRDGLDSIMMKPAGQFQIGTLRGMDQSDCHITLRKHTVNVRGGDALERGEAVEAR